jgi:hypothetical protein
MCFRLWLLTGHTILHSTCHTYAVKPGKYFRKAKTSTNLLSLSPGVGGCCFSEARRDRRVLPRPKFFVSKKRLQQQWPQPRKSVLVSGPGEDDLFNSETMHDKKTAPGPRLFVSAGKLQEQGSKNRKLSWIRVPVKIFSSGIFFLWYSTIRVEWSGPR